MTGNRRCRAERRRGEEGTISHNTWIHRGVRGLVRPLARTRVTPNQVTAVRLATGIAAAVLVAVGSAPWTHVGAAVFVVSLVLDRADGELARLTGRISAAGHRFDLIADSFSNVIILVGLGFGLRGGAFGGWAILLGVVAGLAVASILWAVMRLEVQDGERAAELGSAGGFDPDDAILAVPVLIWFGQSEILLIAAAIGAPAFAVFFLFWFRRRLFAPSEGEQPE